MNSISKGRSVHRMNAVGKETSFRFPFFLGILLLVISCTSKDRAHRHDTYTCPMHPTVIADRPGTCPVCQMDLVRKSRPGEEAAIPEDVALFLGSPNESVITSVRTTRPQYKSIAASIKVQGMVTYDSRHVYTIPARTGGRIERLYLKYAYQRVTKGEKVADIYSPELNTAARELLFLIEHDPKNQALIAAAAAKLRLLGLSDMEINRTIEEKEINNTITIYSPHAGYVIINDQTPATEVRASATGSSASMDGMATTATPKQPVANRTSAPMLKEGDYISPGETLFRLVDDQALRIELNLPAKQSGTIVKGDTLTLDFGKETKLAVVDLVQPFFNEGENFIKLRAYTSRTEGLHIGQLLIAAVHARGTQSLWIPRESVVDLGINKVVFVKEKDAFKPRKVGTGVTSKGLIELTSGLASSEEIAVNAQFLVDSESFIKIPN